jgi:hypothetical protein
MSGMGTAPTTRHDLITMTAEARTLSGLRVKAIVANGPEVGPASEEQAEELIAFLDKAGIDLSDIEDARRPN